MTGLHELWLPILLSSVVVFIVSSIIHMVLPWHKNDYPKVPNEDGVLDTFRFLNLQSGDYLVPRPSSRDELKSTEFKEKVKKGPVVNFTIWPEGGMQMGKNLFFWFIYSIVVSLFAAYITGRALTPGAEYLQVFRFIGTTAFIGYTLALWQMSIWYHRALSLTIKATLDGLIYALLTACVFGWLWP